MTPDTAALRALADARHEVRGGPQDDDPEGRLLFLGFEPRTCGDHRTVGWYRAWCHDCSTWCYPSDSCPGCALILDPDTVRALCDAADEVERLRGVVERVAWRTARIVGDVSRDVIEPLPEGYDPEDLHAKLQTLIGVERAAHAALVADLRAQHKGTHNCLGAWFTDDPVYRGSIANVKPCPVNALLDRHAPEEDL